MLNIIVVGKLWEDLKLENNMNEIVTDSRKRIAVNQATLECVIDASASGSVSRLLSVSTDACIDEISVDGGITAVGKLNAKIICVDNSGAITNYDYISEFEEKFNCDFAEEGASYSAKIIVLDVDSEIKNDKIILQAITEISVFANTSITTSVLSVSDCPAITRLTDVTYTKTVENVDKNLNIIEEYECGVNVDRVLFFDSGAVATNTKLNDSILTVSGEVISTVIYESEGIITTKQFNIPYQEEFSVKSDNGKPRLTVFIADSKLILLDTSDGNIMRLEFKLGVDGVIATEITESIISDVCSATNKITTVCGELNFSRYKGTLCLKDKVSGSALIDGEMDGVHKIIASNIARNCITNTYSSNGVITVEGVLTANVIYENNDTELRPVQIEMPYSLPFDTDKVCDGDEIDINAVVEILSTKIKRDSEIEVTALISISASIFSTSVCQAITAMEIGEKLSNDLPAIMIYQPTKRDDLWSIAKAMLAPIDELVAQNPHLTESIDDKKIVYYRHNRG